MYFKMVCNQVAIYTYVMSVYSGNIVPTAYSIYLPPIPIKNARIHTNYATGTYTLYARINDVIINVLNNILMSTETPVYLDSKEYKRKFNGKSVTYNLASMPYELPIQYNHSIYANRTYTFEPHRCRREYPLGEIPEGLIQPELIAGLPVYCKTTVSLVLENAKFTTMVCNNVQFRILTFKSISGSVTSPMSITAVKIPCKQDKVVESIEHEAGIKDESEEELSSE
jgi:hypothetical protein